MLRAFMPDTIARTTVGLVPPIARPLAAASAAGAPLAPVLQQIVNDLEFDHFMYGVATSLQPTHDSRAFVWTSLPPEWVRLYDERAYVEIDPRLHGAWQSPLPHLWDAATCADTPAQREFFASAARYGVASGVAIGLLHRYDAPAVFVLSSAAPAYDEASRERVTRDLCQVMVLATFVHDLLLASIVEQCLPAPSEGRALSAREIQCLQLAARGMSSRAIGDALSIGERTVHSHFANLLAKLGAANRREAIAKASASGLIGA
jgi:DNA-binding CsgD family transcriptional regulator